MKIRIDDVLALCSIVDTSKNKQVDKLVRYFQDEFGHLEDWDGLCYCGSADLSQWKQEENKEEIQEVYMYKCNECLHIIEPFLLNSIVIKIKEK